jgi:hypothetical protein
MNRIVFELEGVKEVLDALSALDNKTILNIIRSVERKDLNETIIKPLRSAIPNQSLKSGIGITSENGDKTAFKAGIKFGRRTDENRVPDGVLLLWLEAGTKVRTTKKGANRGQVIGRELMAPIIGSNAPNVITYFNDNFATEVDKIIARKLKRLNQ